MKKSIQTTLYLSLFLFILLVSCRKQEEILESAISARNEARSSFPQADLSGGFGQPGVTLDDEAVPDTDPANPFVNIAVRAVIKVGDVTYDSVPASLKITTWKASGQSTTSYRSLVAGINDILLEKAAVKYDLQLTQWGESDQLVLMRSQVIPGKIYTLGGVREAKKLRSEIEYKLVNGSFVAISKKDFEYYPGGQISRILHYLKRADGTPYINKTDSFEYSGFRLTRIKSYNETNEQFSTLSFTYDAQGRIATMFQKEGTDETSATVIYPNTGNSWLSIQYQYNQRSYTMYRNLVFKGGNMTELAAATSHGNSENGFYQYDSNINPYALINWPDLTLSRYSKNNLKGQQKTYTGAFSTVEPYNFVYTYHTDGYPKDVTINHHAFGTWIYQYTTKTVYTY